MANPVLDKTGLAYFWSKIIAKLSTKVDKVDGKGLSANDFTTTYKTKVDNAMPKSGGTFTGAVNFLDDVNGICLTGTWLQTTGTNNLTSKSDKIAVLDSSGIIRYRTPTQISEDLGVSANSGFESSTTTFSTNSAGNKVITQTFSDRTLVSTISTLANGNKQIVETLTKSGSTTTKTTIIDKTTGTITESIS